MVVGDRILISFFYRIQYFLPYNPVETGSKNFKGPSTTITSTTLMIILQVLNLVERMGGEEEKREDDAPRQRRAPSTEQHDNEEASTSQASNFTQEQVGSSFIEKMKILVVSIHVQGG